MALTQADTLPDFFACNSLTAQDAAACFDFLNRWHPGCEMTPVRDQGGCSYTLLVHTLQGDQRIVQFRSQQHAIATDIASDAVRVFPGLTPRLIRSESIHMSNGDKMQLLEMDQLEGICVADVLPRRERLSKDEVSRLQNLLCDLADFFAVAWKSAMLYGKTRTADGLVGSSILERLEMLARDLPIPTLRKSASEAREAVTAGGLEVLPVVLNHGDLIPCNLLVDTGTWRLTGVVDWAESEYLPLGLTLYGVEHLLGVLDESAAQVRFVYYHEADRSREAFWERLRSQICELAQPRIWRAMLLARTIGMLLWHGVAWDDGKRDRAVSIERDVEDLAYLEAFMGTELCSVQAKL